MKLLDTLDLFPSLGGSGRESAQALYIHVNTLHHRLRQVERLTGRSLTSMSDGVDFYIALRSLDVDRPPAVTSSTR